LADEDHILDEVGQLTDLALAANEPDLLLWPESATPRGMYADDLNYEFVMNHAAGGDFAFLLGSVEDDPENGATFNTAKLLTDRGQQIATYRKIHLVPYGEYLPMRPLLEPIVGGLVPGDFAGGTGPVVFELPNPRVKMAALICFEDTLGDLTRRFVVRGAQLIV